MRRTRQALVATALLACLALPAPAPAWTDRERAQVAALSLTHLPPPPPRPDNAVADDPRAAVLGESLFFDPGLSANGKFSCASCHQPALQFTDGLPTARALGEVNRNAPSLLSAAWHRWQFWDGRADSLWMQATIPILNPLELGQTTAGVRTLVRQRHRTAFVELFGAARLDDDAALLASVGKALEAYQRTLRPPRTRFDDFADALGKGDTANTALTPDEQAGLQLFIGKAQCLRCHHSPLFTNESFHNTGLGKRPGKPSDRGRRNGLQPLQDSPFNCRGAYSDDPRRDCPHLDYLRTGAKEWRAAFKVPSLREVARTAPYMHDGRFDSLADVLDHYNRAPGVFEGSGHTELFPLGLDATNLSQLEAFLRTLSAPRDAPP